MGKIVLTNNMVLKRSQLSAGKRQYSGRASNWFSFYWLTKWGEIVYLITRRNDVKENRVENCQSKLNSKSLKYQLTEASELP